VIKGITISILSWMRDANSSVLIQDFILGKNESLVYHFNPNGRTCIIKKDSKELSRK